MLLFEKFDWMKFSCSQFFIKDNVLWSWCSFRFTFYFMLYSCVACFLFLHSFGAFMKMNKFKDEVFSIVDCCLSLLWFATQKYAITRCVFSAIPTKWEREMEKGILFLVRSHFVVRFLNGFYIQFFGIFDFSLLFRFWFFFFIGRFISNRCSGEAREQRRTKKWKRKNIWTMTRRNRCMILQSAPWNNTKEVICNSANRHQN